MRRVDNQELYQSVVKRLKRIAISALCCIPFLIIFAYLTRNIIKSDALIIVIFVAVMLVVVLIVEFIAHKRANKKQDIEEKDVFK